MTDSETAPWDERELDSARWVVHGYVHGVGFRYFVCGHADRLGLSGHVRNRPDGTVEVAATGLRESLDALGRRLLEGPSAARVERVETVVPGPAHDLGGSFEIMM